MVENIYYKKLEDILKVTAEIYNDMSHNDRLTVVIIGCTISHAFFWFFIEFKVERWKIVRAFWVIHSIFWFPVFFHYFWMMSSRTDEFQQLYNAIFYNKYLNPYIEYLFIKYEQKMGVKLVFFYLTYEETLELTKNLVHWMNLYDTLVIKRMEKNHGLIKADYEKCTRWYPVTHPDAVWMKKIIVAQERYLNRHYALFWQAEEIFSPVIYDNRNVSSAAIKIHYSLLMKHWRRWRVGFKLFDVGPVKEENWLGLTWW